jgi:phosphoglycerol transferase MdoB-like AlkP superfamily enzyme
MNKIKVFFQLGLFYLIVSLLLRLCFIAMPITTASFGLWESVQILAIGAINDGLIFILLSAVLMLYLLFISQEKFKKPYNYFILGGYALLILYLTLSNNTVKQYGGVVLDIVLAFLGLKLLCFALLNFLPKQRVAIHKSLYFITLLLYSTLLIFNAISEFFFWNEFGVRYNFTAVDYLIYTTEVINNILESYPMLPITAGILALASVVTYLIFKNTHQHLQAHTGVRNKLKYLGIYVLMCGTALLLLPLMAQESNHKNKFYNELKANGVQKFYTALQQKTLDFKTFYQSLPDQEAQQILLNSLGSKTLLRHIDGQGEELQKNVMLISIESLSAEFLSHHGNIQKITPFLDSLADQSLMFTQLYATGNRTVRGLEALSLCLPPTAGESVVKRQDNKNKFSIGSIFKQKNYQVSYLYGGFSYFDNMKDFFEGNAYKIVDRDQFAENEITFANVWGVCDEDMARKNIAYTNQLHQKGQKFFSHWMTVSNHRPFTYPAGKIDIPHDAKSREGGVKYTDYALKQFFKMAQKQPWFKETVFVIVSDHCASSAGKTDLPLHNYRIPAMVYSPGFVQPQKCHKLMSQIDLMPTVLGLLNFDYDTKILGQNVLSDTYQERAYVATYQDLGLIKNNVLSLISPTKKVKQYQLKLKKDHLSPEFSLFYDQTPMATINQEILKQNIAAYQATSEWLKNKQLDRK